MCFHSKHNLLMYLRSVFFLKRFEKIQKNDFSFENEKSDSSNDNLSNIENQVNNHEKKNFWSILDMI